MEQFPLARVERVEEVYEDGRAKSVTIVQPIKWALGDIARHRNLAAKLARLSAEMETERTRMEIVSDDDLDSAIATELARLAGASKEAVLRAAEGDAGPTEAEP